MKKAAKVRIPKSAMPPGKGPWQCNDADGILLKLSTPLEYRVPKDGEFYWSEVLEVSRIAKGHHEMYDEKRIILTPVKPRKKGK